MNPSQAITKLAQRGWTYYTLAPVVGTHRANLLRIHLKGQDANWRIGQALIVLAGTSRKPAASRKAA